MSQLSCGLFSEGKGSPTSKPSQSPTVPSSFSGGSYGGGCRVQAAEIPQEGCVWKEMDKAGREVLASDALMAKASFPWNQSAL